MTNNSLDSTRYFDVIIIGGGPAGSTCAYKIAAEGYSVLLLEKSKFPRFHIGESMVPYLSKLLEMMNVYEKVKESAFVKKTGVEFLSGSTGELRRQSFSNLADGQYKYTNNLNRARFDKVLLDHAEETGAEVLQEANVNKLLFDGEIITGVEYQHQGQRYTAKAPYVVDASGRAGLVSKHFNLRKRNDRLENVAVFQHYDVVKKNNPGVEGDVLFGSHQDGWLWAIPIESHMMSVGTVIPLSLLKQSNPEKILKEHCDRSARIKSAIKDATPVFDKPKVELDFCYYSEQFSGPGYFIVGDAACFVDPVFSGGVFLSMVCGLKAAEAIHEIYQGRDEQLVHTHFENLCKTGYDSYFRIAYAYYYEFERDMNSMGLNLPGGARFVLQAFAGDFWADEDQPVMSYLRSKKEWNTFKQPFDIVYECPVYQDTHYTTSNLPNLALSQELGFDSIAVESGSKHQQLGSIKNLIMTISNWFVKNSNRLVLFR